MRYAIGVEIQDKKTGNKYNGFYVIGKYGLPFVFTCGSDVDIAETTIDIYSDVEKAKAQVSALARAFRRDDVWHSPNKKSRQIRKFYLVKADSPKFPLVLGETDEKRTKRRNNSKAYLFSERYAS